MTQQARYAAAAVALLPSARLTDDMWVESSKTVNEVSSTFSQKAALLEISTLSAQPASAKPATSAKGVTNFSFI
jgi:hypothetical protein